MLVKLLNLLRHSGPSTTTVVSIKGAREVCPIKPRQRNHFQTFSELFNTED